MVRECLTLKCLCGCLDVGINQVTLLGRAGQDPQLRGTPEHAVTVFPLATSFTLKSADGL